LRVGHESSLLSLKELRLVLAWETGLLRLHAGLLVEESSGLRSKLVQELCVAWLLRLRLLDYRGCGVVLEHRAIEIRNISTLGRLGLRVGDIERDDVNHARDLILDGIGQCGGELTASQAQIT
jgi:hypothetical protein